MHPPKSLLFFVADVIGQITSSMGFSLETQSMTAYMMNISKFSQDEKQNHLQLNKYEEM